jgi:hypothetical protein
VARRWRLSRLIEETAEYHPSASARAAGGTPARNTASSARVTGGRMAVGQLVERVATFRIWPDITEAN